MADLLETTAAVDVNNDWLVGIYQLEQEDLVIGGIDGIDNLQSKQILARINYVKTALLGLNISAFIRTLLDDVDAAMARSTIGAVTQNDIDTAIANLVASSPAALDTLNELAAALGDDPNFATTITNALAAKAPLASPALTGVPTAPTPAGGTNTTQIATTAFVQALLAAVASIGPHTISIPAGALRPRATNGCAALAVTAGAAGQPDVDYLAFDGDVAEYAKITIPMPKGWNEGTVKAEFQWRRSSGAGAANVVWGMQAVAVSDNETPVVNFGVEAVVVDDAKTTTPNFSLSGFTSDCTIGGAPAEGDLVMFEFFRLPANVDDTLAGVDAWLSSVRLTYTTSAATDA